jgi:hypothetical protein
VGAGTPREAYSNPARKVIHVGFRPRPWYQIGVAINDAGLCASQLGAAYSRYCDIGKLFC